MRKKITIAENISHGRNFIQKILSEPPGEINYITFSVFTHWLSKEEIRKNNPLICYAQAVKEGRLEEFGEYWKKYNRAFAEIYDLYKERLQVYLIATEAELNELNKNRQVTSYPIDDYYEAFYTCENYKELETVIEHNVKEVQPFKHLLISGSSVFIEFGFDFTFTVLFEAKNKESAMELAEIFKANGFHVLENTGITGQ